MTLPTPKYSIGDVVYFATTDVKQFTHECPDCLGTHKWKAISPAGAEFEFACPRCSSNYRSESRLSLTYSKYVPSVLTRTIGSVRIDTKAKDPVSYMCHETGVGSGNIYDEKNLHPTHDIAQEAAALKAEGNNSKKGFWVKEQYDETLKLCDYQLKDARTKALEGDLSIARWKLRDIKDEILEAEDLDELKKLAGDDE